MIKVINKFMVLFVKSKKIILILLLLEYLRLRLLWFKFNFKVNFFFKW